MMSINLDDFVTNDMVEAAVEAMDEKFATNGEGPSGLSFIPYDQMKRIGMRAALRAAFAKYLELT